MCCPLACWAFSLGCLLKDRLIALLCFYQRCILVYVWRWMNCCGLYELFHVEHWVVYDRNTLCLGVEWMVYLCWVFLL